MISVDTPRSSAIARLTYFPQDRVLEVTFKSSAVYTYFGVPGSVADDLIRSTDESVGKFFHERIRGHYSFGTVPYPRSPLPLNVLQFRPRVNRTKGAPSALELGLQRFTETRQRLIEERTDANRKVLRDYRIKPPTK